MPFSLEVFDDPRELDRAAARWLAARVRPGAVLGLATGNTPMGMYRELVAMHRRGELSLAGVRTFNLDEYVGLGADDPRSYAAYMLEHLFRWVDIAPGQWHIPDGLNPDPEEEASRYDRLYWELGPCDVQVLGIGRNGHIGFNEPGTPFDQGTHVVELAWETRLANAEAFGSPEAVPERAITLGIRNILAAREILLLAKGASKAEAVRRALEEEPSPDLPASALQLHPRVTVYLDREAARAISRP